MQHVIGGVASAVIGFAVLFGLFALLESIFPERSDQPRAGRRGQSVTDAVWWFAGYAARAAAGLLVLVTVVLVAGRIPHPGSRWIAAQPGWIQFIEVAAISDLLGYGCHRAFHRVSILWPIHAVHHSIEEVDWLSSARVHPLNTILQRPVEVVPLYLLGFNSLHVLPAFALLLALYPIYIHANLRWDYGPLRLCLASPAFHRWHHTAEEQGMDRNYAGLFPWIDLLFGTLYFPQRASRSYGLGSGQRLRPGVWAALRHPFRSAAYAVTVEPIRPS